MPDEQLSDLDHIRKRPGMYVGDTKFFGFIHYLVASVNFFLNRSPTRIDILVDDHGIEITSDVDLSSELIAPLGEGPFEKVQPKSGDLDGPIVNALSQSLLVTASSQGLKRSLAYRRGVRTSFEEVAGKSDVDDAKMRIQPDAEVFEVPYFSSHNLHSYLKRISFLHPTIRFSLQVDGQIFRFHSPGGVIELFDAIATPYQIVHEPIQVFCERDDWQLEAVWAFHSWRSDSGFSFVNKGRAAEGGTHEVGREAAFDQLATLLRCPRDRDGRRVNGIIFVLSITYPRAIWNGCIKEHISNPELEHLVCKALVEGSLEWVADHPSLAKQIPDIRQFNFPDVWLQK